jgi:hypothetical protein
MSIAPILQTILEASLDEFFFNHHMSNDDGTWQMWHFVLCQELDVIGYTGTSSRKHK